MNCGNASFVVHCFFGGVFDNGPVAFQNDTLHAAARDDHDARRALASSHAHSDSVNTDRQTKAGAIM